MSALLEEAAAGAPTTIRRRATRKVASIPALERAPADSVTAAAATAAESDVAAVAGAEPGQKTGSRVGEPNGVSGPTVAVAAETLGDTGRLTHTSRPSPPTSPTAAQASAASERQLSAQHTVAQATPRRSRASASAKQAHTAKHTNCTEQDAHPVGSDHQRSQPGRGVQHGGEQPVRDTRGQYDRSNTDSGSSDDEAGDEAAPMQLGDDLVRQLVAGMAAALGGAGAPASGGDTLHKGRYHTLASVGLWGKFNMLILMHCRPIRRHSLW